MSTRKREATPRQDHPRRKQLERTEEARAKLIDAAIYLLGTNGYSGTTLAEVGRRAGFSRGIVSFHFGTKEQLVLAAIHSIREGIRSRLTAEPRVYGLQAIDRLIENYLLSDARAGQRVRAMHVMIIESVTATPALKSAVVENNAIFRDMISEWIRDASDGGEIQLQGQPGDVATILEGMLRGIILQHLAEPEAIDLPNIAHIAKRIVRVYLQAPCDAQG
ncbi:TetR/AcrR family transcriptional regulator [Mycobacteroides immunogenum]|uniref:TetR/AcrR family transcriptional regulator n=1 Tax=Mycobacteroides immunogenum TaxID=83262 RepID=UPI0005C30D8F|nr:TetR/AcrR family transcriptional regulator [Mycobacteroides immunogenum]KIU42306.1 hypothetical protein TL11_00400 [Mycobacteroides immunogenum]MCV7305438.1 TetR/AcrR family transcriptional regulator [Mycobacteroides immunogenum]